MRKGHTGTSMQRVSTHKRRHAPITFRERFQKCDSKARHEAIQKLTRLAARGKNMEFGDKYGPKNDRTVCYVVVITTGEIVVVGSKDEVPAKNLQYRRFRTPSDALKLLTNYGEPARKGRKRAKKKSAEKRKLSRQDRIIAEMAATKRANDKRNRKTEGLF